MTSTAPIELPAAHTCPSSPSEKVTPPKSILLPPYHTSFPQFTRLIPEIRAKIWAHLLPPPRVILVQQHTKPIKSGSAPSSTIPTRFGVTLRSTSTPNQELGFEKEYRALGVSYGRKQPILLSICKESREEALRSLTLRFKAYWNFKVDYLYIERRRGQVLEDMPGNLRKEGLLDAVRNLAFDIAMFHEAGPEHIMTTLRLLPQVSKTVFFLRSRHQDTHFDFPYYGAWYLLARDSPMQTEYPTHKSWCTPMQQFRSTLEKFLAVDLVENREGWIERGAGTGPEVEFMMLGGRKFYQCDMPAAGSAQYRR